jgi:hypothetical protein
MSGNSDPVYSRQGDVSTNGTTGMSQAITAAANDFTGASANNVLVFTADATNGGFVQRLRFKATGTNSSATTARIFLNNGSANTTAANNAFYGEITLPAVTVSATAAQVDIDYPIGFALNPGFRIYVGLATAPTVGWTCTAIGGKY